MTIQKRKETKFKTREWSIMSYYMEAKNTKEMKLFHALKDMDQEEA